MVAALGRAAALVLVAVGWMLVAATADAADGRQYEQVSPVEKNDGDVFVTVGQSVPFFNFTVARDGQRASYQSHTAFAGNPANGYLTNFVASRTADGWRSTGIDAPNHGPSLGLQQATIAFASDTSAWITLASDPVLDPAAPEGTNNYYLRKLGSDAYSVRTNGRFDPIVPYPNNVFVGSSADLSSIVFESDSLQTADAPVTATQNLYESTASGVRLVTRLPDGTTAPGGGFLGGGPLNGIVHNAVSTDGRRIVFMDALSGQLYVREDGSRTLHASRSRLAVPEPPQLAVYATATPDGRYVFFTTAEALLEQDRDTTPDVYRYDVERDELTSPSLVDGVSANVGVVAGASVDGRIVYFTAAGGGLGPDGLYVAREGAAPAFAAAIDNSDLVLGSPRNVALSRDGAAFAFVSVAGLVPHDRNGWYDVYVYRLSDGTLHCASCRYDGGSGLGPMAPDTLVPRPTLSVQNFNDLRNNARFMTADGSTVYFTTRDPVVESDLNGRLDAYEFDVASGQARLISTGRSSSDSYFVGVSDSGDDVFFTTREALVRQDRDDNVDLYDARRGGGFHAPEERPTCSGDACQGPLQNAPGLGAVATDVPGGQPADEAVPARLRLVGPTRRQQRRFWRTRRLPTTVTSNRDGRATVTLMVKVGSTTYRAAVQRRDLRAGARVRFLLRARGGALLRALRSARRARVEILVGQWAVQGTQEQRFLLVKPPVRRARRAARRRAARSQHENQGAVRRRIGG